MPFQKISDKKLHRAAQFARCNFLFFIPATLRKRYGQSSMLKDVLQG